MSDVNQRLGNGITQPLVLLRDTQHLRELIKNQKKIVGYNTYLGYPKLNHKNTYVLTRKKLNDKVNTFTSLSDLPDDTYYCLGGSYTYEQCLPMTTEIYWTIVLSEEFDDSNNVLVPKDLIKGFQLISMKTIQDKDELGRSVNTIRLHFKRYV